ncbi:anti-repressor SinI family protein [Peribacillus frigoritolerans]|uniref:anti-repressor SinI family protein n=1 Tax=Peribacillus frigoritolerans TaxID=450367 RepID=UPI0021CE3DE6|nr:anti-repressor SinI family protein [Peribacillus frigoritolerans]MCU6603832.1 anti-repressor SinI family protein [Peribacillus frigoritolerans]
MKNVDVEWFAMVMEAKEIGMTQKEIISFLNTYSWNNRTKLINHSTMEGITKWIEKNQKDYEQLILIDEHPKDGYVAYIYKTTPEWCSHCEHEVELKNIFMPQQCPKCEEIILPCNQCESRDCANCPLYSSHSVGYSVLFIGYDIPHALECKIDTVMPFLNKFYPLFECEGDKMHIVPDPHIPMIQNMIDTLNAHYDFNLTLDYSPYHP